jgi:long-chain acyl-CoA synthetase
VCLQCAPLFHVGGLYHLLTTFQAGGANVFVPQPEPELVCEVVQSERCTTAYLVQPMIDQIVGWEGHAQYDLASLRTRSFGPAWDALVTPDRSPRGLVPDAFGQTELCGLVTLTCLGGKGRHGRPIPGAQVRIVDPEGDDVAPGDCGEIVVRGPTVMVGYLNRPDANAERFRDGWYHTNDLGVREADGSITWTGSKSRLIKSGKENIYPQQVEACLREHPAIADCAVIGVPDDVFEQAVRAVVVLRPDSAVTDQDLIEHCRVRLATYKKPRSVVFVDALPRVNGRLDYDAIDAEHGGGGYPGS